MASSETNSKTSSKKQEVKQAKTVFFRDGKRKIDAVLVYDKTKPDLNRDTFLKNLKSNDLDLEEEPSTVEKNIVYIKVHASDKVLDLNAKLYGIPAKFETLTVISEDSVPKPFMNILNNPNPDPDDPIAKRAWKTISKEHPTTYTNCERSAIVFKMMANTHFGNNGEPFKYGVSQMVISGHFIAAYPIHDGPWEWPDDDVSPLNDRQV